MSAPPRTRRFFVVTMVAAVVVGGSWWGGQVRGGDGVRTEPVSAELADLDRLVGLARQADDVGTPIRAPSASPELQALLDEHGGSLGEMDAATLHDAGVEARELAEWMAAGAAPGDEFTSADAWAMAGNPDGSVSPDELLAGTANPQEASVRDIACAAELHILQTAVLLYEMDGESPTSVDDLLGSYLETRPSGWQLSSADGRVNYEAIGDCRVSAEAKG